MLHRKGLGIFFSLIKLKINVQGHRTEYKYFTVSVH